MLNVILNTNNFVFIFIHTNLPANGNMNYIVAHFFLQSVYSHFVQLMESLLLYIKMYSLDIQLLNIESFPCIASWIQQGYSEL